MKYDYALPILLFIASQTIIFIVACVAFYAKTMTKLKELETRVYHVENNEKKIFDKLDELLNAVHGLALKLEHKNNRP